MKERIKEFTAYLIFDLIFVAIVLYPLYSELF